MESPNIPLSLDAATEADPSLAESKGSRRRPRRLALVAVLASAVLLSGCKLSNFGAQKGVTTQANDAIKLWQLFFIAGVVIFVIVMLLILWAIFRYRRRSDALPRQFQYQNLVEIFYTALPIAIVGVLFAFTFVTENRVDALPKQAVTVDVTAFQWGWEFDYPGYGTKVIGIELQDPEMVLPTNENVRVVLRSADVIHGFYVPAFDFSRYAQPGVTNTFDLDIEHAGIYRGQCTQLCGIYHSLMLFRVKAVSPSEFTSWASNLRSNPTPLNSITQAKAAIAQTLGSST